MSVKFLLKRSYAEITPSVYEDLVNIHAMDNLYCPYCNAAPVFESYGSDSWEYECGTRIKYSYDHNKGDIKSVMVELIKSDICKSVTGDLEADII